MGLYFGIADAQGFGGAEAAEDPSAAPDGLRRSIAAAFCSEVSGEPQERPGLSGTPPGAQAAFCLDQGREEGLRPGGHFTG